jgi:serine/threonine-protein kinase RsbT
MQGHFDRMLAVLQRYISPVNAKAMLLRAVQDQGATPENVTREQLRNCSTALRRGMSLFVDPAKLQEALAEIGEVCGGDALRSGPCLIEIRVEADVGRARAEARRICDASGATPFSMQKVATIVSELARNMVLYANGGRVEIAPAINGSRRIVVRAWDQGPGIPNLEEIMSGRYRSKTGLGKGLLGTKRLAERFDISSDSSGTRVSAEISL